MSSKEWLCDDPRFIDPAVRSYSPRSKVSRQHLYDKLQDSLPFLDTTSQIEISSELINRLPDSLNEAEAEGLNLVEIKIGENVISNFQFNECTFRKCVLMPERLQNVTFLNCKLYDCDVVESELSGPVYILGGICVPDISIVLAPNGNSDTVQPPIDSSVRAYQTILRRFWPIGENFSQKPTRPIYKSMDTLCHPIDNFTSMELYQSVLRLIKQGILFETNKSGMIALRTDSIPQAQTLLGDSS